MPTKQWLQVEAGNEIVMYLLLSFISSLDFKLLFVHNEANSGSVYCFESKTKNNSSRHMVGPTLTRFLPKRYTGLHYGRDVYKCASASLQTPGIHVKEFPRWPPTKTLSK